MSASRPSVVGILAVLASCARAPDPVATGSGKAADGSSAKKAAEVQSLSTDEAVRKAYADAIGHALDENDCIERPSSFPGVIVIGGFAHDRGCSMQGLFIDGKLQDRTTAGSWSLRLLETVDFANADRPRQQDLARMYVDEVVHVFGGRFVTTSSKAFDFEDTPAFVPVSVAEHHQGFVIKGWTRLPSGMLDESGFVFMEYAFAPSGQVTATRGERFSVDGARLRGE